MAFRVYDIVFLVSLVFSECHGQTWTDFQNKHVLDPSVDPCYALWSRASWNTWLRYRIPSDYGKKSTNSVITKQTSSLLNDFKDSNPPHNAGPDFHWSSVRLSIYVMKLVSSSGTYDAYRCPDCFALARLDITARPLHFHGYADTQLPSGKLPLNLGSCSKID